MNINVLTAQKVSISISHERARHLLKYNRAQMTVERIRGGFSMESRPTVLNIDNTAFFESMGLKGAEAFSREMAQKGIKAALDAAARYCVQGRMLATGGPGAIADVALLRTGRSIETMLAFIPESPPEISFEGVGVNIEYNPDQLNIKWDKGGVDIQYIPYDLRFFAVYEER